MKTRTIVNHRGSLPAAALLLVAGLGVGSHESASAAPLELPTPQFKLDVNDGPRGDVVMGEVDFGMLLRYDRFHYVSRVTDFQYNGAPGTLRITVGPDCSSGAVPHRIEDGDGNSSSISATDLAIFNDHATAAFNNVNLNHFVDIQNSGSARFSCVLEFDELVKDDSILDDDVPEIIYFERGSGGGNSFLTIEALDADGNVVGRPLLIGPDDGIHCTPPAMVATLNNDLSFKGQQEMTGVAIDMSDLGVVAFQRLRARTPVSSDRDRNGVAYSGGEVEADFKLVVVQTVTDARPAWVVGD
jgi:hypothetical protein